jgi:SAM-dependent methyltransferase
VYHSDMVRTALITLIAVGISATAAIAQTAPEQYKPQVGQPGKDVVWVPSPPEMVERMLDLAKVTPQDVVVDLGSGDGRNVIAAAKRGARALGVEYNPELVELSRRSAAAEGVADRATFVQGDMYEADISSATALALFLLPHNLTKLTPKFLDLQPGTRIVANTFGISGWDPEERTRLEGDCRSWCEAMLYVVPAKVAGTWTLPEGRLTLQQEFQKISGTLVIGNETLPIDKGMLRGGDITFSAGPRAFTGRVTADAIEGTVAVDGRSQPFTARRTDR